MSLNERIHTGFGLPVEGENQQNSPTGINTVSQDLQEAEQNKSLFSLSSLGFLLLTPVPSATLTHQYS